MKKLAVVMSLFSMSLVGAEITGYISESGCGAKHADGSDKSVACVKGCVKKGAAPVFVTDADKKVLKIADADHAKVMDHLGHKVVVNGKVSGETLAIDSVKMAH